jgi:hypothetical protein
MSITTLYAELVVVGTGALLFIVLFAYAFFGDLSFVMKFPTSALGATIVLIPILSVIYLLGIIIANVSHLLFRGFETDLQRKAFEKEKIEGGEYEKVRNELYTSRDAQNLVHDFEFRRSKVRICRGWYLNSLLIIVAILACFGTGRIALSTTVFCSIAFALLAAGAFLSWYTATITELQWMKSFAKPPTPAAKPAQTMPPFISD